MKRTLLLAISISISGCASSGFSKPGGKYESFMADRFDCMKIASNAHCANNGLYVSCMAQKGWAEDSNGFKPPEGASVRMCR